MISSNIQKATRTNFKTRDQGLALKSYMPKKTKWRYMTSQILKSIFSSIGEGRGLHFLQELKFTILSSHNCNKGGGGIDW